MDTILYYFLQNVILFGAAVVLAAGYVLYMLGRLAAGNKPSSTFSQSAQLGNFNFDPLSWTIFLIVVSSLTIIWLLIVMLAPEFLFIKISGLISWIFNQIQISY